MQLKNHLRGYYDNQSQKAQIFTDFWWNNWVFSKPITKNFPIPKNQTFNVFHFSTTGSKEKCAKFDFRWNDYITTKPIAKNLVFQKSVRGKLVAYFGNQSQKCLLPKELLIYTTNYSSFIRISHEKRVNFADIQQSNCMFMQPDAKKSHSLKYHLQKSSIFQQPVF